MRVTIPIILLSFILSACAADLPVSMEFASYADGKEFDFKITHDEIQRTPIWPVDVAFPPFSARKAQALARKQMDSLVSDGRKWPLERVCLEDMGDNLHWLYIVEFGLPPSKAPGLHSVIEDRFRIVVLMDGTVIKPVITSHPL